MFEGPENTIDDALGYIDYSLWGEKLLVQTLCRPKPLGTLSGGQELIVETPWFSARWLPVPPGGTVSVREDLPHVLICVRGSGRLSAPGCDLRLESRPTTFREFSETGGCYAGIVHGETEAYSIENTETEPMRLLAAFGT